MQQVFVWPSENQRTGASDHEKKGHEKKRVLLDSVPTVGEKKGITRPRPDGG